MNAIRRFWKQQSTHYRNFQIVYALLLISFAVPTVFYVFAPGQAIELFGRLNVILGGSNWEQPGNQGYLWRVLAIANVATLGFMCLWVMRSLRERFRAIVPMVFLKGTAAVGWLVAFFGTPEYYPAMLAAALLNLATCAALIGFAVVALADIQDTPDPALVPQPLSSDLPGWAPFEQKWAESVLAAALPASPDGQTPGLAEVDLKSFWPEFARHMPMHYRFGLRAAAWVVTFWPIFTFRSVRTFHNISEESRDEILQAIEGSDNFLVRQITFVLKSVAAFAYFRDSRAQNLYPSAYPGDECVDEGLGSSEQAGRDRQDNDEIEQPDASPSRHSVETQ